MSWINQISNLSWEDIEAILNRYEALGPIPGIAAPLIEAFIPVLPLIAILVANVNAYGLWEGILLSWCGVVAGAVCVFLLARKYGGRFRGYIDRKFPQSRKFIGWVEKKGFTPIFVLSCFPFTPSVLVNVVSGISKIPFHTFATATMLGKGVMIILVSVAGHDLGSMLRQPWKLALVALVFVLLWLSGRKLESRYMK